MACRVAWQGDVTEAPLLVPPSGVPKEELQPEARRNALRKASKSIERRGSSRIFIDFRPFSVSFARISSWCRLPVSC